MRCIWRRPFKVLLELHNIGVNHRTERVKKQIEAKGIDVIWASSHARLSKYHSGSPEDKAMDISVVDQYDKWEKPTPINDSTEIFKKYEGTRVIDRLYVAPEDYTEAEKILKATN